MRPLMSISSRCAMLAVVILLAGCAPVASSLHGSPYPTPSTAPGLALSDTRGSPFDLATLRGHAAFVYFGYTQCPDECPLTLANAQWMIGELGEVGERVDFVLVTVDPANDTPAVLRAYLDRFNSRFIGLTGSDEQLALARVAYGVLAATPESDHEHTDVIHGTRVYLIDSAGNLVTSYDLSVPKEDILSDLRAILQS
jgi:protein SCO1/2